MPGAQACCHSLQIALCEGPSLSPQECHANGGISGSLAGCEERVWGGASPQCAASPRPPNLLEQLLKVPSVTGKLCASPNRV